MKKFAVLTAAVAILTVSLPVYLGSCMMIRHPFSKWYELSVKQVVSYTLTGTF